MRSAACALNPFSSLGGGLRLWHPEWDAAGELVVRGRTWFSPRNRAQRRCSGRESGRRKRESEERGSPPGAGPRGVEGPVQTAAEVSQEDAQRASGDRRGGRWEQAQGTGTRKAHKTPRGWFRADGGALGCRGGMWVPLSALTFWFTLRGAVGYGFEFGEPSRWQDFKRLRKSVP